MFDTNQWVTQLVIVEDKKTPTKSIQEHTPEILTDSNTSPISRMVVKVILLVSNVFLPSLDTLLDTQGNIPTN